MNRLPVHPRPLPEESLSSWLERLAACYDMHCDRFMKHVWNVDALSNDDLDIDPKPMLLNAISRSTGFSPSTLRALTVEAYVPFLIDSLEAHQGCFEAYVSQFPTLAPARFAFDRGVRGLDEEAWLPWLERTAPIRSRGCPDCLRADPVPYRRIHWRPIWLASCPTHGVSLTSIEGGPLVPWRFMERTPANPDTVWLDGLKLAAVTKGTVRLPDGHEIGGPIWVRALRTLFDELLRSQADLRKGRRSVHDIRERLAGEERGRSWLRHPNENLRPETRKSLHDLVAKAVRELVEGAIEPNPVVADMNGIGTVFSPVPERPQGDLQSIPSPLSITGDIVFDEHVREARRCPVYAYRLRRSLIRAWDHNGIKPAEEYLRELAVPIIKRFPERSPSVS